MKFAFYTLGCKTNQYETQAMEHLLLEKGHEIGSFEEACDGYVINTCSVTAVADKKNRAVIRRCRRDNPQAVIAVCGCYSQHDPDAVRALGIDVIGGSGQRQAFVEMLLDAAGEKRHEEQLDNALGRREFECLPAGGLEERTRAMLKVQDGCVNFCTYCIIPYTRGPIRSAPLEVAVAQAKELAVRGYREIVLTGIEIAGWGQDQPGKPELALLVEEICKAVPDLRIRLGSLEPRVVTEDFCRRLSVFPNLCPQFHLSMQSGSDTVLSRMKRKYDTARYYQSVELLRKFFPECAVTTDMIVAFPGETEEEFEETISLIQQVHYDSLFTFIFSPRPGTPAAKMEDPTPKEEKNRRFDRLCAIQNAISEEIHAGYVGKTLRCLVDGRDKDMLTARTEGGRLVRFAGSDSLIGSYHDLTITGATTWSLTAAPVK